MLKENGQAAGGDGMVFDSIIIGGGIAGLQTAIQLSRCLRKVAVVDANGGRSTAAKAYRNILGFPDGVSGKALREAGRTHAVRLGVQLFSDEVSELSERDGLFSARLRVAGSHLQGRTVVLAAGISDPFPDIPGIGACLGKSVFICPDCDGYETVGQATAVIGAVPQAADMAVQLRYYTDRLTVINHAGSPIGPREGETFQSLSLDVLNERVERFDHQNGMLTGLVLSGGDTLSVCRAFLAFPGARVNTDLLRPFSVRFNEKGHVLVDPRTKETDHRNIWAVGDVIPHSQQVAIAMGDGAQAAIWIHKRLQENGE
jgi:thioredoxin reductase (NADPH)